MDDCFDLRTSFITAVLKRGRSGDYATVKALKEKKKKPTVVTHDH